MATPVFECLRTHLPQAKIIGVLKQNAHGILRDSPWFDAFIDSNDKSWAGLRQLRRQLRDLRPDAAILLTNSFRSALTMRLSGVKRLYGYCREGRGPLLAGGPTVSRNAQGIVPMPMVDYYLELCRWLGLAIPSPVRSRLFVGETLRQRGNALLKQCGIDATDVVIGLNPGASFGASKCWPPEYFAELADGYRHRPNTRIVLFTGPGEEAIARIILDRTKAEVIDMATQGVDLEMLKPLIQRCNLLITNDTGPRHYAVAFDVPVVVIFGPTDPAYTATNLDRTVVVRKELACSPCHKKICPRQHECMREIKPAEVFDAAETLLRSCA